MNFKLALPLLALLAGSASAKEARFLCLAQSDGGTNHELSGKILEGGAIAELTYRSGVGSRMEPVKTRLNGGYGSFRLLGVSMEAANGSGRVSIEAVPRNVSHEPPAEGPIPQPDFAAEKSVDFLGGIIFSPTGSQSFSVGTNCRVSE